MADDDTIVDIKRDFLQAQVRLLNAPLEPPLDWRDGAPVPEEGDLSENIVDDILKKVNRLSQQHNRAVYSSQALRHVSEQIDQLYWNTSEPASRGKYVHVLQQDVNLAEPGNVTQIPETWPMEASSSQGLEEHAELKRYGQLRARILELHAEREVQRKTLARTKKLLELLKPFTDPQSSIQPNIASKDCELAKELEKMRMLIARVGGRISTLPDDEHPPTVDVNNLPSDEEKLTSIFPSS